MKNAIVCPISNRWLAQISSDYTTSNQPIRLREICACLRDAVEPSHVPPFFESVLLLAPKASAQSHAGLRKLPPESDRAHSACPAHCSHECAQSSPQCPA